jgi:hypothetical protein
VKNQIIVGWRKLRNKNSRDFTGHQIIFLQITGNEKDEASGQHGK